MTRAHLHAQPVIKDRGKPVYIFESTPIRLDPRMSLGSRVRAQVNAWLKPKDASQRSEDKGSNKSSQPNDEKVIQQKKPSAKEISTELSNKRKAIFNEVRSLKLREIPPTEPLPRMMKLTRVAAQILDGTMEVKEANEELAIVFPKYPGQCETRRCILDFVMESSQVVYDEQEKIITLLEKEARRSRKKQKAHAGLKSKFREYTIAAQYPIRDAYQYIQLELGNALKDESFVAELKSFHPASADSCTKTVEAFLSQEGL